MARSGLELMTYHTHSHHYTTDPVDDDLTDAFLYYLIKDYITGYNLSLIWSWLCLKYKEFSFGYVCLTIDNYYVSVYCLHKIIYLAGNIIHFILRWQLQTIPDVTWKIKKWLHQCCYYSCKCKQNCKYTYLQHYLYMIPHKNDLDNIENVSCI